jgi:hypothetical protein
MVVASAFVSECEEMALVRLMFARRGGWHCARGTECVVEIEEEDSLVSASEMVAGGVSCIAVCVVAGDFVVVSGIVDLVRIEVGAASMVVVSRTLGFVAAVVAVVVVLRLVMAGSPCCGEDRLVVVEIDKQVLDCILDRMLVDPDMVAILAYGFENILAVDMQDCCCSSAVDANLGQHSYDVAVRSASRPA